MGTGPISNITGKTRLVGGEQAQQVIILDSSGNIVSSFGGGASFTDNSAFTPGTTAVSPVAGEVDDTAPSAASEGSAAAFRMSTRRELYAQIRDAAGNERGVNVTAGNALSVDVGSVTIGTFPDNEPFNVAQINGVTPLMGAGNTGTGSPRVTIASDQAVIPVGGNVAHDGVDSGNPTKIGGNAQANERTAVADGDRVDGWFDPIGRQVCLLGHASPEAPVTANGSAAGVSVIAAPGASLSLYICKGSLHNSAATEAVTSLRDGAAGTIRFTANLAADGGGTLFDFGSRGWKLTANTALVMDAVSATQYCNVTEYYIAA